MPIFDRLVAACRTAISVPDELFAEADQAARDLGLSRSALYSRALAEFLKRRRETEITARINEALEREPDEIDPLVQAMAIETMKRMEWAE